MSERLLSLCMIVRDEAAMLPGFLASVAGLWDELVVADTGSKDGSPDLIRAAGGTVVDFPWIDDFAAARNASLAAATGRWVLFLDADERIDAELAAAISALKSDDGGVGAATVVMRNAVPGGGHTSARLLRLFRNTPEIRFRHRVHEDVADDVAAYLGQRRLALRHLPGAVDHLGYVRATAAGRNKKDRDLRLLRLALADDPGDLYCRFKVLELARYWGDDALAAGEVDAARRAFEAAPAEALAGRPWVDACAALIAQFLPGPPAGALAWLDRQSRRVDAGPLWRLRQGALAEQCDRPDEAERAYGASLELAGAAAPAEAYSPGTARALLGLCRVAARRGDLARAAGLARRALAVEPADAEALLAVASFSPAAEAAAFLGAHARQGADVARAVAQALLAAGRAEPSLSALEGWLGDGRCALGAVVVALVLDRSVDVVIELDQPAADAELRSWLEVLVNVPRAGLRDGFVARAGALAGVFPWLPEWLDGRLPVPVSPSPR